MEFTQAEERIFDDAIIRENAYYMESYHKSPESLAALAVLRNVLLKVKMQLKYKWNYTENNYFPLPLQEGIFTPTVQPIENRVEVQLDNGDIRSAWMVKHDCYGYRWMYEYNENLAQCLPRNVVRWRFIEPLKGVES